MTAWWDDMEWSFITEYVHGSAVDMTPQPALEKASESVFKLFSAKSAVEAFAQIKHFVDIHGWVCPLNPLQCHLPPLSDLSDADIEAIGVMAGQVIFGLSELIRLGPFDAHKHVSNLLSREEA